MVLIWFYAARNGEYDPSKEESEDLERALAAAYKDIRDAKEKLDKWARAGDQSSQLMDVNDEEWTKHITDSLLNSVPTNPASVTATHLTPGNGLASDLIKDNLNVLDGTDLTASSLSLPGQVINASVGSISSAASNGGATALPYNWINFNLGSVPSSLSDPSVSNCTNLLITTNNSNSSSSSKQTSLLPSQSLPAELALSSSQISASVSHTPYSIYRSSASNSRTLLATNSKQLSLDGTAHSLGDLAAQQPSSELKISPSPTVQQQEASQQVTSRAARGLPAIHSSVSPAEVVLSAHLNINSQTSPQMTTPSIQIPSSQPATLQTLLSMQNRSTSIWPSGTAPAAAAATTSGISINYFNGLPSTGRSSFVQNMDTGPPLGSTAKYQLNSHLDSGEYKQDLTFTSLAHSMGTSHGGAQTTGTEKNQGAKIGPPQPFKSSGENT